ncbi:MAG: thiamine phosphate synthase [Marinilabiliaceae bacterium]
MESKKKAISGGLYLVLDPAKDISVLIEKLKQALEGGTEIVQIWNNWRDHHSLADKEQIIQNVLNEARKYQVTVLINEEWQWLKRTNLDGVHFDSFPEDIERIREEVNRDFIAGVTCSNDLEVVRKAEEHSLDYVSFCAMFPSSSVDSCEIVRPETVRKARAMTNIPLFLSGGITSHNMEELRELDFDGVAVISGIMSADLPAEAATEYKNSLNHLKTEQ